MIGRRRFLAAGVALAAAGTLGIPGAAFASPSARWRIALATHSYHELNLRRLLPRVVDLGVERIELNDNHVSLLASPADIARTRAFLRRAGVDAVGSFTGRFRDDDAHNGRIFTVAARLGLEYIDGYPPPALVPRLLPLAREHGVRLALLNTAAARPYGGPGAVAELLDRHPDLATVVDVGHYARAGHDPAAVLRRFGDRVVAVHAKDLTTTEGAESDDPYTVIGTGVLDWQALAGVLDETGYRGYVTLSYTGNFWNHFEREPRIAASLDNLRALRAGDPLPHAHPPDSALRENA